MKILSVALLLLIISCHKNSQASSSTSNPEIQVELLFEHEGCKMYRFDDQGYYVRCGDISATSWNESCGKNCIRKQFLPSIPTKEGN